MAPGTGGQYIKILRCVKICQEAYGQRRYDILSQVMAGAADGLLAMKEPCSIYRLMLGLQPADLQKISDRPLSRKNWILRAEFIRGELPDLK